MLSRLYTLLLAIVVGISSLAFFGPLGIGVCMIVFAMARAIVTGQWERFISVVLAILFAGFLFVQAGVDIPREAAYRVMCMNNLKQITLAVLLYEHANGALPPPYIADKNGKRMHSWRVLILPYLGHKDLFDQYDFNEPWDGPNNKKLLTARPPEYFCPSDEQVSGKGWTNTSYVAIVGSSAAWVKDTPRNIDDMLRHASTTTTAMLAETADADIKWTEPRDISLDELQAARSLKEVVAVNSKHSRYRQDLFYDYEAESPVVANMAFADGHVMCVTGGLLTLDRQPNVLKIGGFEEYLDNDQAGDAPYPGPKFKAKLRLSSCIVLLVWVVSVSLLLYQAVWYRRKARADQLTQSANQTPIAGG